MRLHRCRASRARRSTLGLELLEQRLAPAAGDGVPDVYRPDAAAEGAPYVVTLDADGAAVVRWEIDWGDGTSQVLPGSATSASHVYADGPAAYDAIFRAVPVADLDLVQWSPTAGGNGHWYALTPSASSWTQAEAFAVAAGGHLASVTSAAEQQFLVNTFLGPGSERNLYWIGLNDFAQEGTFVWTTGEPLTYTNWAAGEPNDWQGAEDAVAFNWWFAGGGGLWNDSPDSGVNGLPVHGILEFNALPTGPAYTTVFEVTVNNAGPTAWLEGPAGCSEGDTLTFTLRAGDPSAADQAAGFTFAIDWDGDGTTDEVVTGPDGTTVSHTFLDSGTQHVRVRATDRDGGQGPAGRFDVHVANVPPAAWLEGPASVTAGVAARFTLRVNDPSPADRAAGFTFSLDWDGDGAADETLFGGDGTTVDHTFATSGAVTVGLVATDADGGASAPAGLPVEVAVPHAPPTAAVTGPTAGVRAQPLTFTLHASAPDASPQAIYTFVVDWNGDGTPDEFVTGPSGVTVTHAFADAGAFTVRVTATDPAGATGAPAELGVSVSVVALQPDPTDPGRTLLAVGGTPGNDTILFTPGKQGGVQVWLNGTHLGLFYPTGGVAAYGGGGDDWLEINGLKLPGALFGGAGNDVLVGGRDDDVLVGGDGNDWVYDPVGRNVLVGGAGCDVIVGGKSSVIIHGSTGFDNDLAALRALAVECASASGAGVNKKK